MPSIQATSLWASLPSSLPLGALLWSHRVEVQLRSPCCVHSPWEPHASGRELGGPGSGRGTQQEGSESGWPPPLGSLAWGRGGGWALLPPNKKEKGTLIKARVRVVEEPLSSIYLPARSSRCARLRPVCAASLISPLQNARNKSLCTLTLTRESPLPRSSWGMGCHYGGGGVRLKSSSSASLFCEGNQKIILPGETRL